MANFKVTDFGLSALPDHLRQDGVQHTTCGTPTYVAREVIGRKGYDDAKADQYLVVRVILYVLFVGSLPLQNDNIISLYRKIYKGDFKCPSCLSPEPRKLISQMLEPNPITRISIAKIMSLSWFRKSMSVAKEKEE